MVTYPIYVSRDRYRGRDTRKQARAAETNRMAMQLEQHINALLLAQERPVQQYSYHEISEETGVPLDVVRDLCFAIDGGHNGFTAIKRGLTMDQAFAEQEKQFGAGQ